MKQLQESGTWISISAWKKAPCRGWAVDSLISAWIEVPTNTPLPFIFMYCVRLSMVNPQGEGFWVVIFLLLSTFFWKTTNLLYSCPGNNHFGDMNWGRLRNKLALTQSDGGAKFYEIGWTHISEKLGQLKKLETPVCFTSWQEGRNGAVFIRTHKFPTCG